MTTIEAIRDAVESLKETYELQSVSIFGSYADGRATPASDLDLLIEFQTPAVSLITQNALKYDLEDALGLPVDVIHAPVPSDSLITIGNVVKVL